MSDKNAWPRLTQPLWSGLSILLGVALVVQVLLTIASSQELWTGVMTAEAIAQNPMMIAFGLGTLLLLLVWVLVFLLCVVYTCRITFRMMKNLDGLGASGERTSPTMAVVWYFIPVANIFLPYRAVKQIWKGTFELAPEPGPDDGVITAWWVCWVLSNITSTVSFRMSMDAGGMNEMGPHNVELYMTSLWVSLASGVLLVAACWLMLRVFGPLSRAQDALIAARAR